MEDLKLVMFISILLTRLNEEKNSTDASQAGITLSFLQNIAVSGVIFVVISWEEVTLMMCRS